MTQIPPEFNLEKLIDRLIFFEKVELGLKQSKEGKTIPPEEMVEMNRNWQKFNTIKSHKKT
ncbi:MAG: hypothetical protein ABIO44_00310 [Saprospiraceae bacterium]